MLVCFLGYLTLETCGKPCANCLTPPQLLRKDDEKEQAEYLDDAGMYFLFVVHSQSRGRKMSTIFLVCCFDSQLLIVTV